ASAMARPMPRAPPVTREIFPSSLPMSSSFVSGGGGAVVDAENPFGLPLEFSERVGRAIDARHVAMAEAMHEMAAADILGRRHLRATLVDRERAARRQEAAGRQIDRARDLAFQADAGSERQVRMRQQHRGEQADAVRMAR